MPGEEPPATQLRDRGQSYRKTFGNSRTRRIPYHVVNVDPQMIDWGVGGLPDKFAPHPEDEAALARSFEVQDFLDGRSARVVVEYRTADIRHGASPPPQPEVSRPIWNVTFREEITKVPYAFTRTMYFDAFDGMTPVVNEVPVWDFAIGDVRETRTVVSASWPIFSPTFPDWEAVSRQHNKIHRIGGIEMLFQAGALRVRDDQEYEFAGTWVIDEGTLAVVGFNSDDGDVPATGVRFPGVDASSNILFVSTAPGQDHNGNQLMRDPYHQLIVVPPEEGVTPEGSPKPIRVFQRRLFSSDFSGYLTLPGNPF